MQRDTVLAKLRDHEPELRSAGILSLSIFGSVARGTTTSASDIDVLIRLDEHSTQGGFAYFGQLDDIARRLETILGQPVDLIAEPVRKPELRHAIEQDAARAF